MVCVFVWLCVNIVCGMLYTCVCTCVCVYVYVCLCVRACVCLCLGVCGVL
jgi:hypothetical protein